jgi:hypothetical protein
VHKKALYNLLRLNWRADPALYVDPWQVEDYRQLSVETLFERLGQLGISLNRESLTQVLEQVSDPEDLTDCFSELIRDPAELDAVYLLFFELWRKLAPDRHTLSIFCDEIDYRIEMYDSGLPDASAAVEEIIALLANLLDQNCSEGADPKEVFYAVCERCATDVESFFYDFVSDLIEQGDEAAAAEYIERFYPYVLQSHWLIFLRLRLAAIKDDDGEDIEALTADFFSLYSQEWDLDFSFEVLDFVLQTEQYHYFLPLMKHLFVGAQVEQDFRDLCFELRDYLQESEIVDTEALEVIESVIESRKELPVDGALERDDPDLQCIIRLIHDKCE